MLYSIATTIVFHVVSFTCFNTPYSQEIATLEINMSASHSAFDIPVHFSLHEIRAVT
jgi:hypothetical protein